MVAKGRTMRKLFVFIFFSLPWIVWAQKEPPSRVTIDLKNISLEEALTILAITYSVEFSYSDDIVPTHEIVNLSIHDEHLPSVLDNLLQKFNVAYKIVNKRVLLKRSQRVLFQTIRGTVLDQVTNEPLPGASIIIVKSVPLIGTPSDSLGKFKINNVPIGRVTVSVSCVGYNTRTVDNVLIGSGKELVLDLKISESVIAMNELVVTAQKDDAIPGDGVALTSSKSFSVEETKRYAGSMGDPARMVTAFAGVTGASDESNALIIRGNSPRGVLWRIEGIEVPNPNHFTTEGASGGVVSVISTNMIETSDFITGAFPAQYGNSLSGVFDINLRKGNNQQYEHSIQAGLLGMEMSAEGPLSRAKSSSYLVNYRYSTLSILDKLGVDLNQAGQYKDYQDLSFNINCPAKGSGTFSLFGIGGKSRSDLTQEKAFDKNTSDLGILGLTYRNKISENSSLQGALSISGTQIAKDNEISGLNGGLLKVEESYSKSYMRASVSVKTRINPRYVLEGGLIHSLLDYNFYLRNRDPDNIPYQEIINFKERGNTSVTQGFLYARQYFFPALFGFYGMHFMNFALTNDRAWEPRLGLRWQPSETTSWSVAYGKHGRIENLQYYLARDHQAGGNEVQINKDLGFTRANHIVLTFEKALRMDHKIKLEAYYQRLYNAPVQLDPASLYSSINEDTGFITDTLVNKGSGRNYGVELSFDKSFSNNFYYLLNGSLYESKFTIAAQPERNTAYNGNYSVHLLAGKEFNCRQHKDRLGLNIKLTGAGGRRIVPIHEEKSKEEGRPVYIWERAFDEKLPDYFRADFQLVYKKNNPGYSIEWRLDIQNVTNHRNASYYYFNATEGSVRLKRQVGFLPLLSCRVDF